MNACICMPKLLMGKIIRMVKDCSMTMPNWRVLSFSCPLSLSGKCICSLAIKRKGVGAAGGMEVKAAVVHMASSVVQVLNLEA